MAWVPWGRMAWEQWALAAPWAWVLGQAMAAKGLVVMPLVAAVMEEAQAVGEAVPRADTGHIEKAKFSPLPSGCTDAVQAMSG